MKKYFLISLVACVLLNSCEESDTTENLIDGETEEYTINLNLRSEVSFEDTPINGRSASNDEVTYYGIQITDNLNGNTHASGLFDELPTELPITLLSGRTYLAEVVAFRKGDSFGIVRPSDSTISLGLNEIVITNEIAYNVPLEFSVSSTLGIGLYASPDSSSIEEPSFDFFQPSLVEAFYGSEEIDTDLLEATGENVSITLLRNVFAYEVVVSGLTRGTIDVFIASRLTTFSVGGDSTDLKTLSFPSLSDDPANDQQLFSVSVFYNDVIDGIEVSTRLFSDFGVPFNRLFKKNILIQAPNSSDGDSGANDFPFSISLEDAPIQDGDTINIE